MIQKIIGKIIGNTVCKVAAGVLAAGLILLFLVICLMVGLINKSAEVARDFISEVSTAICRSADQPQIHIYQQPSTPVSLSQK